VRPLLGARVALAALVALGLASCQAAVPRPEEAPGSAGARTGLALGSTLRVLQGNRRFRRGDDTAATLRYLQALGSWGGARWRPWVIYDLGTQYVALGELRAGLRLLGEEDTRRLPGPVRAGNELAFRRAFNLGVARFEAGEFQEAAWSFIEALRRKPNSWDAKHNLELSIRSSLGGLKRAADAASPRSETQAGDQARRLLQRLHEQEEPVWKSAPSAEPYAQDW
jgi:hypothetical protein